LAFIVIERPILILVVVSASKNKNAANTEIAMTNRLRRHADERAQQHEEEEDERTEDSTMLKTKLMMT